MATPVARPALGPIGTTRRPAVMALLYVVTGGFYLLYWLYKTYQELRAHAPGCTTVTPGQAVGRSFIPFYNVYWLFRIMRETARMIARVRRDASCDERMLNVRFVTWWYGTTVTVGNLAAAMNMAAFPLFLCVHFYPLIVWQRILNAHWALVRKEGANAAALPVPPVQPEPPPNATVRQALGLDGPGVDWQAAGAFLLAAVAALYFDQIGGQALLGDRHLDLRWSLTLFSGGFAVLRAGLVLAVFRRMRNAAAAAIVVGALFAVGSAVWRWAMTAMVRRDVEISFAPDLVAAFAWTELFVVALIVALRWFRPAWLALWMATLGWSVLGELLAKLHGLGDSGGSLIKMSYSEGLEVLPYAFGFALTWYLARRFSPNAWFSAAGAAVLLLVVPAGLAAWERFSPKQLTFDVSVVGDVSPATTYRLSVAGKTHPDFTGGLNYQLGLVEGESSTTFGDEMLPAMSAQALYPCGWREARVEPSTPLLAEEMKIMARVQRPMSLRLRVTAATRPDVVRLWLDNRSHFGTVRVALGQDEVHVPPGTGVHRLLFPAPDCEEGTVVRVDGREVGRIALASRTSATALSAYGLADPQSETAATRDYLVDVTGTHCYAARELPAEASSSDQPRRGPQYPEKRFGNAGLHRLPPVNFGHVLGSTRATEPRYAGSLGPVQHWLVEVPCE